MKTATITYLTFSESEQFTLREFIDTLDVAPLESNITVTLSDKSIVFSITHKDD